MTRMIYTAYASFDLYQGARIMICLLSVLLFVVSPSMLTVNTYLPGLNPRYSTGISVVVVVFSNPGPFRVQV